jgi:xanthine dehydrogenase accessory factor
MIVLIRGAGDLASGVALRLWRAGLRVIMTELPQPLAVRRLVSFSEAVYTGETTVEGVTARRVADPADTFKILNVLAKGHMPVLIDPDGQSVSGLHPAVLIDARMLKAPVTLEPERVSLIVGLGPGFTAGVNCHAVVETNRGPRLGRVLWEGAGEPDTGRPEPVLEQAQSRILRAPAAGELHTHAELGTLVQAGQTVAEVAGQAIQAPFAGVLRGLLRPGLAVAAGLKIGDLDPRGDPALCRLVSDKSLAVAGGVLEAILTRLNLRPILWK